MHLPWSWVTAVPSTGLESIDGVITKFLQDKDSLHCIALFNVTQLYENLKTNKKQTKQDTTLLTHQHWMKSKHFILKKLTMLNLFYSVWKVKIKQLHVECKRLLLRKEKKSTLWEVSMIKRIHGRRLDEEKCSKLQTKGLFHQWSVSEPQLFLVFFGCKQQRSLK